MWSDLDPNLTEIQLPQALPEPWRNQSWWTPAAITDLAFRCPKLTSVNLDRCRMVTDDTITALASHYPNLTNLNLYGCYQLNDSVLTELPTRCPNLNKVNLGGRLEVTDDMITQFAIHCPNLAEFYLGGCGGVTETSLLNLARCCRRLRANMMSPEWHVSSPIPVDITKLQAIESRSRFASLRIKRFWREVCYNPVYRYARERIQRMVESE